MRRSRSAAVTPDVNSDGALKIKEQNDTIPKSKPSAKSIKREIIEIDDDDDTIMGEAHNALASKNNVDHEGEVSAWV